MCFVFKHLFSTGKTFRLFVAFLFIFGFFFTKVSFKFTVVFCGQGLPAQRLIKPPSVTPTGFGSTCPLDVLPENFAPQKQEFVQSHMLSALMKALREKSCCKRSVISKRALDFSGGGVEGRSDA